MLYILFHNYFNRDVVQLVNECVRCRDVQILIKRPALCDLTGSRWITRARMLEMRRDATVERRADSRRPFPARRREARRGLIYRRTVELLRARARVLPKVKSSQAIPRWPRLTGLLPNATTHTTLSFLPAIDIIVNITIHLFINSERSNSIVTWSPLQSISPLRIGANLPFVRSNELRWRERRTRVRSRAAREPPPRSERRKQAWGTRTETTRRGGGRWIERSIERRGGTAREMNGSIHNV